jgi:hypothetical protein
VIFKTPVRSDAEDVSEIYANAKLIVKAVNTYEQTQADVAELREALEALIQVALNSPTGLQGGVAIGKARAVLARHAGAGKA